MTELERLAAAVLLPSFPGTDVPAWVRRWLARGLGGITLFADNGRDRDDFARLTGALGGAAPELLVAVDEEGGDVTRLEAARGSSYPGNLALGVVDDEGLTEAVARAMAGELLRAGIGMNLAPVADVNTNPDNPVIGVRSFGADAELAARHVAAFVRGTQSLRVAACAKHFPGHGDTSVDSHRALPAVAGDLEAALMPFRAAIAAGVRAVMVGHLVVPAYGAEPATVNRRLVQELLRGELGFEGLVVSDALEMAALSDSVGVAEGAVRALAAGVDALCLGRDLHEEAVALVHGGIVEAVASGRLSRDRLADAAARVRETAGWTAARDHAEEPPRELGREAAARALRVHGDPSVAAPPLVVELAPEANIAAGEAEHGLASVWPGAVGLRLRGSDDAARLALDEHRGRPLILVVRDAARHPWQQALAQELAVLRPDLVAVEVGVPGWRPPFSVALVESHGAGRANLEAVARLLSSPT